MPTELYPYQLEGAKTIRKFKGRALLADDMGLGKTIQALFYMFKCPKKRPVIIVCPANLKWVWKAQAIEHMDLRFQILEGRTPPIKRTKQITEPPQVVIINYDILAYWVDYLLSLKAKILVIDEVHYVKNKKASRTKAIRKLAKKIPYLIPISGTPLLSRPSELFVTLNMLWPKVNNISVIFGAIDIILFGALLLNTANQKKLIGGGNLKGLQI